ncbi:universal stress protein [Sphingorhabdus sp.]|uniref:universal stress protein n=1 Tax=Sphingorhabdus sp. TaxID=1902408 RepID=UPI0035B37465
MACIDGSAVGPTVFAHARALAHSLELPIAVAQVVEARKSSAAPRDPFEWQIICREGRSRLHHFAAVCGVVPEPVEEVLLHGSASEEINRWAKDNHVGFLVVATHRPSAGRTSLLGSTARRLLESGERSLLLIPPDVPAEANVRYRRLVVPLDGSRRAESVLPVALRIARQNEAEILLVHVVPTPELFDAGPDDGRARELCAEFHDAGARMASHYLDTLRFRLANENIGVRVKILDHGDPRVCLKKIADAEVADLIIMSAHGHTGLVDQPCGSVTAYLANHLAVPLLIIHNESAATPRRAAFRSKLSGRTLLASSTH